MLEVGAMLEGQQEGGMRTKEDIGKLMPEAEMQLQFSWKINKSSNDKFPSSKMKPCSQVVNMTKQEAFKLARNPDKMEVLKDYYIPSWSMGEQVDGNITELSGEFTHYRSEMYDVELYTDISEDEDEIFEREIQNVKSGTTTQEGHVRTMRPETNVVGSAIYINPRLYVADGSDSLTWEWQGKYLLGPQSQPNLRGKAQNVPVGLGCH